MKWLKAIAFAAGLALISQPTHAAEYRLQPHSGYASENTVGYFINGNTITGSCIYWYFRPCSGRGCHSTQKVYHYDQCSWDFQGNILRDLTVVGGWLGVVAPDPLFTDGTRTIYAITDDGLVTTGVDSAFPGGPQGDTSIGFVDDGT